jgi:hypothetical protein
MSDVQAEPRPERPSSHEDPLASDWSEGIPGPVRAHGLPLPKRIGQPAAAAAAAADVEEAQHAFESPGAAETAAEFAEFAAPEVSAMPAAAEQEAAWTPPPAAAKPAESAEWAAQEANAEFDPVQAPSAETFQSGGEPEAWAQKEESPWSGPAPEQPTEEWKAPEEAEAHWSAPAAEPEKPQWSAPAESEQATTHEWMAPPDATPHLPPATASSAIPDESTWSMPPPSDGDDLTAEPSAPSWTQEERPVFAPLAAGESLAGENDEMSPDLPPPTPLRPTEQSLVDRGMDAELQPVELGPGDELHPVELTDADELRPVEDADAQAALRPVEPLEEQAASLEPLVVVDPDLQPIEGGPEAQVFGKSLPPPPLDLHDDPDLLVPVNDTGPVLFPPTGPAGDHVLTGEHRVAVHTRGGRTRRGSVTDLDLARPQFALQPQGGGSTETVSHSEVKAIFFMLGPGERAQQGDGPKLRVTFSDGRAIEGHRIGDDVPQGFFIVPLDAQRTNTRRIFVSQGAVSDVAEI